MLGAIIGDVVGSVYEFGSDKTKDFPLFSEGCHPTDDSILTIAVGCACVMSDCYNEAKFKYKLKKMMRKLGRKYPDAGFGGMFYFWMMDDKAKAYGSYGNGSAMRVLPVAWAADTLEDVERIAGWSAEVTHNHPDGIKGAQALASAVFLARTGKSKEKIKNYIESKYYSIDFTLDEIRENYVADVSCKGSVPQAIECFLESSDFEDAVRNAISLGGDCDTQANMAGAIAEAYYGIPDNIKEKIFNYLDDDLMDYYWTYADILYNMN